MSTNQARCRLCSKPIEWIEYVDFLTGELKKIPLDINSRTYQFNPDLRGWQRSNAMVSHFAVCKAFEVKEEKVPRQTSLPYKED